MTAPNPAVTALPGWRGTDPDGGTWVRLMSAAGTGNPIPVWRYVSPSGPVWRYVSPSGGSDYRRTQEEAEAAGLEPLYAASDFEAQGWERVAECVKDCPVCCADLTFAAPALLDPGNPEDLREVDKFLGRFYASIGIASSSAGSVCKQLRSVADRLDREQHEAQARLERNPQAVEAIRQAEKDLTEGRAVTVEVQSASGTYLNEVDASVALLDPGNPEDLRQVAQVLNHFTAFKHRLGDIEGQRAAVMLFHLIRSEANRLDRERAEAEQDAADRKRAEEYANGFEDATPDDRRGLRQGYLAGIRAERARQEAGQ